MRPALAALPMALAAGALPAAAAAAPSPGRSDRRGLRRWRQLRCDAHDRLRRARQPRRRAGDRRGWSVQYLPAGASADQPVAGHPADRLDRPGQALPRRGGEGHRRHGRPAHPGRHRHDRHVRHRGHGRAGQRAPTPLTCKTVADCAADPRIRDLVGYGSRASSARPRRPPPRATRPRPPGPRTSPTRTTTRPTSPSARRPRSTPRARAPATDPDPDPSPATSASTTSRAPRGCPRCAARRSPDVPGVVTATRAIGRPRLLDPGPQPDADAAHQRGRLRLHRRGDADRAVGDAVLRHRHGRRVPPGRRTGIANQTLTELTAPTGPCCPRATRVPAPELVVPNAVPAGYVPTAGGGSIESLPLDPADVRPGLLRVPRGQHVQVDDARVVGPTTAFGEAWITVKPRQNPTARGGTVYLGYDQPEQRPAQDQVAPDRAAAVPGQRRRRARRRDRRPARVHQLRRLHPRGDARSAQHVTGGLSPR